MIGVGGIAQENPRVITSGFYDIRRFPLPYVHSWPDAPQGSLTTQVVTPANVGTYITQNGYKLIFSAGDYGGVTMSANDQHWVVRPDANLQGITVSGTANRIRAEHEYPRVGDVGRIIVQNGSRNILFNQIFGEYTPSGAHQIASSRCAFVRCHLRAGSYGLFCAADTGDYLMDDVTIAKCLIEVTTTTNAHLTRWYSANRLTFVDNRVIDVSGGGDHLGFRFHTDGAAYSTGGLGDVEGAYIGGNEFIYATGAFGHALKPGTSGDFPGGQVDNLIFEDNLTYYTVSGGTVQWETVNYYNSHKFRNNIFYGGGSIPTPPGSAPLWDVSGNVINAYQAPSDWSW